MKGDEKIDDIIHVTLKKVTILTHPIYWRVVGYEVSEEVYNRILELLEKEIPRQNNIPSEVTGYRIVIEKSKTVWQQKTEYFKEGRLEKDVPITYDVKEELYNGILEILLEKNCEKVYEDPERD